MKSFVPKQPKKSWKSRQMSLQWTEDEFSLSIHSHLLKGLTEKLLILPIDNPKLKN